MRRDRLAIGLPTACRKKRAIIISSSRGDLLHKPRTEPDLSITTFCTLRYGKVKQIWGEIDKPGFLQILYCRPRESKSYTVNHDYSCHGGSWPLVKCKGRP